MPGLHAVFLGPGYSDLANLQREVARGEISPSGPSPISEWHPIRSMPQILLGGFAQSILCEEVCFASSTDISTVGVFKASAKDQYRAQASL